MSKLVEKILKEGKVFGSLYHFTDFESIFSILQTNKLIAHREYVKKGKENWEYDTLIGVSTTRSKEFIENGHVKTSVRVKLNAEKITNKYKVRPFKNFKEIEESEELILTGENGLQNVKQYITEIYIDPTKENNKEWTAKIKLVLKKINESGIPLSIDEMWLDWIEENPDKFKDYE